MGVFGKKQFLLFFIMFFSVFVNAQTYKVVEDVRGQGVDYRTAKLDAFRSAIEKAYGVNIAGSTEVKNFEAIADTILSTSKGFIQSFDGEKVETKDGIYLVFFNRVVISKESETIPDKIKEMSEGLKSLNFPSISLLSENLDPTFVSYLENFLVNQVGITIVPVDKSECIIEPHLEITKGELKVRGRIKNRQGEVISSCANVTIRFINENDKKYASHILIISLLEKLIIWPIITIKDVDAWQKAEILEKEIKKLPIVISCGLRKYEKSEAEYSVRVKGNLKQLASELMETKLFDSQKILMDQPKKILTIFFTGHPTLEIVKKNWFEEYKKDVEKKTEELEKKLKEAIENKLKELSIAHKTFNTQTTQNNDVNGGISVIDTGYFADRGESYLVSIIGNPNTEGSASYRSVIIGIITVYTGWNGNLISFISWTELVKTGAIGIGNLHASVVFLHEGKESTSFIRVGGTRPQIRLKVSGYHPKYIGSYQVVNFIKLVP